MTVYGNNLGAPATYYCWEGGQVIADFRAGTSSNLVWEKSYVYLGGRLLATADISGTKYHHPDRLGTRLITDTSGNVTTEQVNLPYGTALATESSGAISNRRFTSYDRSATTGMDYAVNRFYNSAQGRFNQVDPIGMAAANLADPQSLNLYSYCGNDPINRLDPDGLFWGKLFGWVGKIFKWIAIAAVVAIAVLTVIPGAWAGTVLAKLSIWAAKHTILASLLGVHLPSFVISNIASASGVVAAGFWALAGAGAVNSFLTQNPVTVPAPPRPAPPPRIPIADPSEEAPRTGIRGVYWLEIYAAAANDFKNWLFPKSAKRAAANKVDPNCLNIQYHHAILYDNSFNHQNHPLVRDAGVNLALDPRNIRPVLGHGGGHTKAYNLEVGRRLDAAYNSLSVFSTQHQLNVALGNVIRGIWRDIDNGTLRPYNKNDVYVCK